MSLRPGSPSKERKRRYKTGISVEEGRRKREEYLVGVRKIKRQTTLLKKREESIRSCDTLLDVIPEVVKRLCHEFPHKQKEATAHLRTMLTLGESPPQIDEVIKYGILPCFADLLARDDAPQVQLEVLWILSNFATETPLHKSAILEVGVLPFLVKFLSSTDEDTREEAACLIGNIVGDSPDFRDLVLNHGALKPLLNLLQPDSTLGVRRAVAWCLCVLLRGVPPVNLEQVEIALPALRQLIHSTDEEILIDTCWALAYFSEGPVDKSRAIIELGVYPRLLQLLQHPSDIVVLPALQALGNIAAWDEAHTQFVIDHQLLPSLREVLTRKYTRDIFKEACWTISNITAGTPAQVQAVIDANIIPHLVEIIQNAELEVKREIALAIFNITTKGSCDNIRYVVAEGCVEALCQVLTSPDLTMVTVCLEALVNILGVGEVGKDENGNIFAKRVEECGGLDKIEQLQMHENSEIVTRASWMSDSFWGENEIEDNIGVSLLDFFTRNPSNTSSSH